MMPLKFIKFFRQRPGNILIIISLALIVGLLYALPHFLIGQNLESNNQPFVLMQLTTHSDETHGYIPRAREIYEGKFPPQPSIFPWLTSLVFAFFIFIARGDINLAYIISTFVMPAITFLLFYFLSHYLWRDKIWSILIALTGVFTAAAIYFTAMLKSWQNFLNMFLKNFIPLVNTPMERLFLTRIDNPLITLPFYLAALLGILWFWQKPNFKKAIFAGLTVGSLFYVYFHYWVYVVIVLSLLGFYLFWGFIRNKHKQDFYYFLVLIGIVAIVSLPYFINYLKFNAVSSPDFIQRLGIENGWQFRISRVFEYSFYAITALLVCVVFGRKNKKLAILWGAFIGAMFVVWNIQIVSGFVPQIKWDRPINPVLLIIYAGILRELLKAGKLLRFARIVSVVLIFLLISKKIVNASFFIQPNQEILKQYTFDKDKELIDSWQWIEINIPANSVVLSPSFATSFYLSDYTSGEPFLWPGLSVSGSNIELERRLSAAYKFFKVDSQILEKQLQKESAVLCQQECMGHKAINLLEVTDNLYYNYYKDQSFDKSYRDNFDLSLKQWSVPQNKIQEILDSFSKAGTEWSLSGAEYVYYGPQERELSLIDLSKEKALNLVYKNQAVEIYKIIKP